METRIELKPKNNTIKSTGIKSWLSKLSTGFRNLFKAEEVEVTFKVEGTKVRYTYTKVEEKKVA